MSTNVRSNYSKNYFKMQNILARSGDIMNDQEFRLLSYYTSQPTSWTMRMTTIMKDLGWSESKVKRVRVSLQSKAYLLVRRLPSNEFIYYIGKQAVKEYLEDKQGDGSEDRLSKAEHLILELSSQDDRYTHSMADDA